MTLSLQPAISRREDSLEFLLAIIYAVHKKSRSNSRENDNVILINAAVVKLRK